MEALEELKSILLQKSVCEGEFTLVSGITSNFYVDSKLTTLSPRSAILIGEVGWKMVEEFATQFALELDSIGGLTLGADPIALSISMQSYRKNPAKALETIAVRKNAKAHGRNKLIEGNFGEGDSVVVVDDVITTGGSTLQAIDAIEKAGGKVAFVLVLVDREEGGREAIESKGHKVLSIFTRSELEERPDNRELSEAAC